MVHDNDARRAAEEEYNSQMAADVAGVSASQFWRQAQLSSAHAPQQRRWLTLLRVWLLTSTLSCVAHNAPG